MCNYSYTWHANLCTCSKFYSAMICMMVFCWPRMNTFCTYFFVNSFGWNIKTWLSSKRSKDHTAKIVTPFGMLRKPVSKNLMNFPERSIIYRCTVVLLKVLRFLLDSAILVTVNDTLILILFRRKQINWIFHGVSL